MTTTTTWSGVAIALFCAVDVLVVLLILIAVRRKNRYRGFEVITKPDLSKGQEARKD